MVLMTPEHGRWNEFVDALLGPDGCDVRIQDREDDDWAWQCDGNFARAAAILRGMGDFDVKNSFNILNDRFAACCDCDLLSHCASERLDEWLRDLKSEGPHR